MLCGLLLALCFAPSSTRPSSDLTAPSVDDKVAVRLTTPSLNRMTATFDVYATIVNTSPATLDAPMGLAITGTTPSGVRLVNAAGTTVDDFRYVNVPIDSRGFMPRRAVTVLLKFGNVSSVRFTISRSVRAIVRPAPSLLSFTPNPASIAAGSVRSFTLAITNPSTVTPMAITLTSASPAIVSVAPTIVASAGRTTATVTLAGRVVGGPVTVTARLGTSSATTNVTVATSLAAVPAITSITFDAPSYNLMVSGAGFGAKSIVRIDGVTVVHKLISNTKITVNVTGTSLGVTHVISVMNPSPGGGMAFSTYALKLTNWVGHNAAIPDAAWLAIVWAKELGLLVATSDRGVMTSPDGINWTAHPTPGKSEFWRGLAWSPKLRLLVALSDRGDFGMMTSHDAVNWIPVSVPSSGWVGITWSEDLGIFVAVSYLAGINLVMTSSDGINWVQRITPPMSGAFGVCWSKELGLFVIVSDGDVSFTPNRIFTSRDGVNWTAYPGMLGTPMLNVVWSREVGMFVGIGFEASPALEHGGTSPDGATWTPRAASADDEWLDLVWAREPGLFVAVAQAGSGHKVMTSADGINWTGEPDADNDDDNFQAITWAKELGLFVAVGYGGPHQVMTATIALK